MRVSNIHPILFVQQTNLINKFQFASEQTILIGETYITRQSWIAIIIFMNEKNEKGNVKFV